MPQVVAVMTPFPHSVDIDAPLEAAIELMKARGFRHLPVVEASGRILGVFSVRDALPREVDTAVGIAEFHEQVNDARG